MSIFFETTFSHATCPDRTEDPIPGLHWEASDYWQDYLPGHRPTFDMVDQLNGVPTGGYTVLGGPNQPTGDCAILTAANYPGGGGGKGFRFWQGNASSGVNDNSGAMGIDLLGSYTELWIRFYMRYQAGMMWENGNNPVYDKCLDFNLGSPERWIFGHQGGAWGIFYGASAQGGSVNWNDLMGGSASDGLFHCFEIHIKHGAFPNGIGEVWVDNVLTLSHSPPDSITSAGWRTGSTAGLVLGDNQAAVGDATGKPVSAGGVPTDWYRDMDDFAFSATGRIGPLNGAPALINPMPNESAMYS